MDVGGDIIGSHAWQSLYAFQWFVPSQDVFNIFVEYNGGDSLGLAPVDLELCAGWLFLLRKVIVALIPSPRRWHDPIRNPRKMCICYVHTGSG